MEENKKSEESSPLIIEINPEIVILQGQLFFQKLA